jgi:cyclic pyranopterin phosphate synthase
MSNDFSHVSKDVHSGMVDVSKKSDSVRVAKAESYVIIGNNIMTKLEEKSFVTHKGPIFNTAIIAGTSAVKNTWSLIPLCHLLPIDSCKINIEKNDSEKLRITCEVKTNGKTGVEMEALVGASITALTIYDMVKSMSHEIMIGPTHLLEKKGGKSDFVK